MESKNLSKTLFLKDKLRSFSETARELPERQRSEFSGNAIASFR